MNDSLKTKIHKLISELQISNFAVTFLGRGFGGMLNLLFVIFAAKLLGNEKFGFFSLALTVTQIALQFSGQGMEMVLVRFYVLHVKEKTATEGNILRSCFYVRIVLTALVVVLGIFCSELYVDCFHRPELRVPLIFGFLGCAASSLWYYFLAIFQAREEYARFSFFTGGINAVRIIALGILVLLNSIAVVSLLSVYVASFVLGVSVAYFFLPRHLLREHRGGATVREEAHRIFGFGKWVILSTLFYILYNRLDILLLTTFRTMSEVGHYSAAISLLNAFDLLIVALFTVFLPNASKIVSYEETLDYLRFTFRICLMASIVLLFIYYFSEDLVLITLGNEYRASIDCFRILFPGFIIYLFVSPMALIMFSYNMPHLLVICDIILLLFNICSGLMFIPTYGPVAASFISLSSKVLHSVLILYLVVTQSKRLKKGEFTISSTLIVNQE